MNTTQTTSPRRNHVAATIENNGHRVGHVVARGLRFQAIRKNGVQGSDIRKVATFRSLTAAIAWVEAAA